MMEFEEKGEDSIFGGNPEPPAYVGHSDIKKVSFQDQCLGFLDPHKMATKSRGFSVKHDF